MIAEYKPETTNQSRSVTAFQGARRVASGTLSHVIGRLKEELTPDSRDDVLIFDDTTGAQVEADLRDGTTSVEPEVAASDLPSEPLPAQGPGRPKLGVVPREVTLLPRHWDWLNRQPGGASVALRRLVEEARKTQGGKDRQRQAQEAAYKFMSAMAGNRPGFEEATRALFAGNQARFEEQMTLWPLDIRDYANLLAAPAFANPE